LSGVLLFLAAVLAGAARATLGATAAKARSA
jgi:hypothetical protein